MFGCVLVSGRSGLGAFTVQEFRKFRVQHLGFRV